MHDRGFWELDDIEDETLERALLELVRRTGASDARILAHLAEVEERRLHLLAAFPSMYAYCIGRLRLSEDEAYRRIVCARLAWRFPVIFSMIEGRGLHLTALYLLRRHLTEGNHAELLQAACGKTKKEVEELLAVRFPLPDVPSTIRKLPDVAPFSKVEQRSAETFRIQINASKAFKEKLEWACDLVSHSVPDRDLAKVLERGLDLLIAKVERERFGKLSKPPKAARAAAPVQDERTVGPPTEPLPAAVQAAARTSYSDAAAPDQVSSRSGTGAPDQVSSRSSPAAPDQVSSRSSPAAPDQVSSRSSAGAPDQVSTRSSAGAPDQVSTRSSAGAPDQVSTRSGAAAPDQVSTRSGTGAPDQVSTRSGTGSGGREAA